MKSTLSFGVLVCLVNLVLSAGEENVRNVFLNVPGFGKVKGKVRTAANGENYISYKNIPYGRVREDGWFQRAEPVPRSKEVVNQLDDITCPYLSQSFFYEEERYRNCLLLKVDSKNTTEKKPVIVYLPGVQLVEKSMYHVYGKYIMAKDVVVVAVQHRLGAFGFLSTSTNDIPGNIGALDVIDALKWIQKHIEYFGGDPDRVTLNGEYMAAGLIGVLTGCPLADGLFHQVIYQSGSMDIPNLVTDNPLKFSAKVAYELGCPNVVDEDDITNCLLDASFSDVVKAYRVAWKQSQGAVNPITVGELSGIYDWEHSPRRYPTLGGFVDHPIIYLQQALQSIDEPARFSQAYYAQQAKDKLERLQRNVLPLPELLRELYGDNVQIDLNITDALLVSLMKAYIPSEIDVSSLQIKLGVIKSLLNNKRLGGSSYLYVFKYKPEVHNYYSTSDDILTNFTTIGDDVKYIYSDDEFNEEEKKISDLMVDLWTSFAATGVPRSLKILSWPKLFSAAGPYLSIDKVTKVRVSVVKEFTPTIDCQKTKGCEWAKI